MKLALILLFVFSGSIHSQYMAEHQSIILPQGYGIKLLSSTGVSSINTDVSNVGFMNPSSLVNFSGYSAGFSYQLNSKIKEAYFAGIGTSRTNNWLPQSIGVVIPIRGLNIGLSFGQKYNGTLDFDPIPTTTSQNPDGTGEFYTVDFNTSVYSYAVTLNSSIKDLFTDNSLFSLGLRYSLNRLNHSFKAGIFGFDIGDNASNFAVGSQLKIGFGNAGKLTIGISYETSIDFNERIQEYSNFGLNFPDSNFIPVLTTIKLVDRIPDELRFDVSADISNYFSIITNVTYVLWKTSKINLKNQIEFSASSVYKLSELVSPSIGLFYTDKNYKEDFFDINKKNNAVYITAGIKFNHNLFYADLAVADSHLFSGEFRKQTISKLSIGIIL